MTVDTYALDIWRLIRSAPADGASNMAVDEAILRAVAMGQSPPTLRFYAWEPACLSLGRGQTVADVDREALQAQGFDLVRRPTGGKAILHVDELTYSVVVPQSDARVVGDVVASYRRLSSALILGLQRLGVPDVVADQRLENRHAQGAVCFEAPSDYEITTGGRKLAGSAQMRAQDTVLQHGAMPLYGDITRICRCLTAHPDPARVQARAATVEQALGRAIAWEAAVEAM
ncbi:MAG TPA: lipoate--protein ligase family protein, partial [Chloroflexi bacterium]|nr:lipoate--protein ligase family protein [Chloroflexota bacterium]